ncbi:hypothetical protein ACOME3_001359 [Neoechinorhynchus agilis]
MGVPAFFRWLSGKYQLILARADERYKHNQPSDFDYNRDVDLTLPNPNNIEFDNLYLDMNGIIHPCFHPTNKPAPKSEEEIILAIYKYIDRLMAVIRPRRLLYMAVDGVAPRAKLNQQRARRFVAGEERLSREKKLAEKRRRLEEDGKLVPESESLGILDSNCITPGTEFMWRLSEYLRFYIINRLESNPGWARLKVILSDSSVPGEGEHKIMDFIRRQRCQAGYDPNTKHCLCGADADLIMLGLISHEPHFTIIREEFVTNEAPVCDLCGRKGHAFEKPHNAHLNEIDIFNPPILVITYRSSFPIDGGYRVNKFHYTRELERSIDDWVFLCFFVGNDFFPNIPCLEIRESAIDSLVHMYGEIINESRGLDYLCTDSRGVPDMKIVRKLLMKLSNSEDSIMRENREKLYRFMHNRNARLIKDGKNPETIPADTIRLGDEGYKIRYYNKKFKVEAEQVKRFSLEVAKHYARGLCWVCQYYFRGCSAWEWYYPYHYAPFAADLLKGQTLAKTFTGFDRNTGEPFTPMQQLMAVFPSSSASVVPQPLRDLMTNPESPIIDFYPTTFQLDQNGKRYKWQSVVLLSFIDAVRLRKYVVPIERDLLSNDEKRRNVVGYDRLFFRNNERNFVDKNALELLMAALKEKTEVDIGKVLKNLFGYCTIDELYPGYGESIQSPLSNLPSIQNVSSFCLRFKDPQMTQENQIGKLLPGVILPDLDLRFSMMNIRSGNQYYDHSTYDNRNFNLPNEDVFRRENRGSDRSYRSYASSPRTPRPPIACVRRSSVRFPIQQRAPLLTRVQQQQRYDQRSFNINRSTYTRNPCYFNRSSYHHQDPQGYEIDFFPRILRQNSERRPRRRYDGTSFGTNRTMRRT